MSEAIKLDNEVEELSLRLDELNTGRRQSSDNRETDELLAVAVLIKKAAEPGFPPQHVLDKCVERAHDGLKSSKKNSLRSWLYSGALGSAAAVMLIIGLNLIPSWTQQTLPVLPPVTNSDLSTPQEIIQSEKPPAVSQTIPAEQPKQPVVEKIAPAQIQPSLPAEQPEHIKPLVPATNSAPKDQVPMISQLEATYKASVNSSLERKSTSHPVTVLSLPGQAPDTIAIDNDTGIVRQVFNKGTEQELTITQQPKENETGQSKSTARVMAENEEKPGAFNSVTVSIYDQHVTLEGRHTRQQLLLLAQSLKP